MKDLTKTELKNITGGSKLGKTLRPPKIYLPGPVKPKLEIM